MKRILSIGIVTVDIMAKPFNVIPERGKLHKIDSVSMHVGGCASNAACDLAKLGIGSDLVVKMGKDGFADFVRGYLKENKVGTENIVISEEGETGSTVVLLSGDGERTFLHNPGANDLLVSDDVPDALIEKSDIVFIAGTFLMHGFDGQECLKVLKRAHSMGKFTVLDTAWDFRGGWMDTLKPCIAELDLFMPSYDEAVMLAGGEEDTDRLADLFFSLGAKNVVIKCGSKGAYICESGKPRFMSPSYFTPDVLDTTGAGDSFCAGFLAGLAGGEEYAVCAKYGNATGRFCVSAVGASSGIPTLDELKAFIAEREGQ